MDALRTLPVVLVVGLVLVSGSAVGATVDPNFEVITPEPELQPGTETQFTVQLLNSADEPEDTARTARDVRVELAPNDSNPISVKTGTRVVGEMRDGQLRDVPFRVAVPRDIPAGEYDFTLEVTYEFGVGDSETVEKQVTVRVEERARFRIVDTESDVAVDDSGTVTLTVENVGEATARDASVRLNSRSSDVTLGGAASDTRYVGGWDPGEQRTVEYKATVSSDGASQQYALAATVLYEDDDDIPQESATLSTGFTPDPESGFGLSEADSNLRVDQKGSVSGVVENEMDVPARNAVVVLEVDNPNVEVRETEYALGTLDPGETAAFSFDLEISSNANAGPRQFSYVVRYRNEDDEVRRSEPLDARYEVRAKQDQFDVTVENATYTAGSGGELTLSVTNAREQAVSDVSAKLFSDSPISTTDDEAYVAGLDPGESATLTFGIEVANGALAKAYPVSVDFRYDDADGDTLLSDTYKIPIQVEQPSNDGPGLELILAGAVLLLLVVVGGAYVVFRR